MMADGQSSRCPWRATEGDKGRRRTEQVRRVQSGATL